MKRAAITTIIVLATITILVVLWEFRQAIILFLFSLGTATAVRPAVDRLVARGFNRPLASILIYLSGILILSGIFVAVSSRLVADLQLLADQFALTYDRIWVQWPTGTALEKAIVNQLPPPPELYEAITGEQGTVIAQTIVGFTSGSLSLLSQFFAVIILGIYWTIDRVHFERLWLSFLPVEVRARAREIWRDVEIGVGRYIRSELIQSILAGVILGLGYSAIGLPYPALLAIIGAIAWLIPWLGAILAIVPVLLSAMTIGIVHTIVAPIFTLLTLLFLEIVIEPRLYPRNTHSSLLMILFMIALADVFGLIGIILAPPISAAVQLFMRHLMQPSPQSVSADMNVKIDDLIKQLEEIQTTLQEKEDVSPQVNNLVDRLGKLLKKADDLLV